MYGGAAGGGKSDALLMAALQFVDYPGYAALIFRRTYADLSLPGAIMDRAGDWLGGTAAKWNGTEKTWTFPTGSTLTFGYLEHENDKYRYQGAELQMIGFDELTQFSETQYRYLFSRLRRLQGVELPVRMRSASNPGGVGHDWVYNRFFTEGRAAGRYFVPSMLTENPHLDAEEYLQSLAELDPYTKALLLKGDWTAKPPGRKFRREWFKVVDEAPADAKAVRFWDLAATEPKPGKDPDWTAGALVAFKGGQYWIKDLVRTRATPGGVEDLVRQTAEMDGRAVDIWMEQEPGSSGVNTIHHYATQVLVGFTFRGRRATGSKEVRANPVSSAAQAGNIFLVRARWNGAFLDEVVSFPGGSHDDQVDAVSGGTEILATQPPEPPKVAPLGATHASAWRLA